MTRRQFIESHGATCDNWQWSWSFVNHEQRFVIFGEWQNREKGVIFSEDWESRNGRKNNAYPQSREHIRLVEQEGYTLMTFPMLATEESADESRPHIKKIEERLYQRTLVRKGRNWYAKGKGFPKITVKKEIQAKWTRAELKASIEAYLQIQRRSRAGEKFSKRYYYEMLAARSGRSIKSIEYRMQNISYVLSLHGREWVKGLVPAKNVGTNVIAEIESILAEIEGREVDPSIVFEDKVQKRVGRKKIPKPTGNKTPIRTTSTSTGFKRDEDVVVWVLQTANGKCESCKKPAPFKKVDGDPFLEVHHVRALADGGSDRVENAVAICPNCHRGFHHSREKQKMMESLFSRIKRLIKE